jgi:hypothetical protein
LPLDFLSQPAAATSLAEAVSVLRESACRSCTPRRRLLDWLIVDPSSI